jgi:phytoene dehydrogenase-like protein
MKERSTMADNKLTRRSFITAAGISAAALTFDLTRVKAHAARMGPKSDYPVVVIGAGLGGLTCAAYLARQGIPVTVVEQHAVPGGYATAFQRQGGKYTFEVSLHGTSIHNNTPARILDDLGVLSKLELVRLPETYRIKTAAGDVVVPQTDPNGYIDAMAARFPQEAEGIRGFVEEMLAVHRETETYGNKSVFYKKYLKLLFPLLYPTMWKMRSMTLDDLLARHVQSPAARHLLSFLWGYYGLPPSKLSGFYYALATGEYLKNGSYYIKDRSQRLSDLLAESIESAGGTIIYDTSVERVLLDRQAVAGVVLSDERVLPARAVVCNASALTLFERLLPQEAVPAGYLNKLKSYRPSISCFLVWLGLNRSITDLVPGYSTAVTSGDSPEKDYERGISGDIENVSYSVCAYDHLYPGYSAPGTSTLMIITLCGYEPWRQFEADYQKGDKQAYHAQKTRWAETLIRRAEHDLIPGLAGMIDVQEAATPLTNRRYTGNTEGAIYGFEQSMENAYMNRISNRTPIQGLYLAGAWGDPGGGYAGVLRSGQRTFEMMMREWGA